MQIAFSRIWTQIVVSISYDKHERYITIGILVSILNGSLYI